MSNTDFAARTKRNQITWALANGIEPEMLETRNNQVSWVLKKQHKKRNLHNPDWWRFIEGHEHRWARALNSSQCFGINLFAPLAEDPGVARAVWLRLLPSRPLEPNDEITVQFEHTPKGAPECLGEKGQPTQVDVLLTVNRNGTAIGNLLVEVKLTESAFGKCRGAAMQTPKRKGNPDPSRCLDLVQVLRNPATQCWLVQSQQRRYWKLITDPGTSFRHESLATLSACPFRHGLYQIMRNRLLADWLVGNKHGEWADVGVCIHPANRKARLLPEKIFGETDVLQAFGHLTPNTPLSLIDPREVVHAASDRNRKWLPWASAITSRYGL